ncbi:MAG: ABC transporter ATP-binding protein [Pseudomonadota bacterium]
MSDAKRSSAIAREFAGLFKSERFDDRIDVNAEISNREVLKIIGRSLTLLGTVRYLFLAKFCLAIFALIPGLIAPWIGKITIDQVILGKAVDESLVRFPPHISPFIDYIEGMGRVEVMLAITTLLAVIILLFGRLGAGSGVMLSTGADSATQSEAKLNSGYSQASGLFGAVEALIHVRLTQYLVNGLRTRLFEGMAKLPMMTIDDHRIGDSVYRVMYDAPDVPLICFRLTLEPIFTLVGVLISLYLIQYSYGEVAPELVWVAALLIPIALAVTLPLSGYIRRVQQASRASGAATTNAIEESMSNIQAVQSLGGMSRERDRISDKSNESFRRFRHVRLMEIGVSVMSTLLTVGLAVFVTIYVTDRVFQETMTPGDFSVLFGLALTIGGAGLSIGMLWIGLQGNVAAVRRVFFFVDLETEDELHGLPDLGEIRRDLRFDHVHFAYPNGHPALTDINFEMKVGELVAIVGPTGAGKTSLAHLIPGFYRPTRGRVLIDGQDIARVNVDSVRSQVSYVFQEHMLMSESIRDNFLLVNPLATDAQIREACRIAEALEFVDELPDGLDTVLGQSGNTLSVGQKQRLCIARGLVRDTRVLILDEPTAALDPRTEHLLVRALRTASVGRLVVVIAHRLSTIRHADRIVFLEDGVVTDIGSHDELVSDRDGRYRRFVELQGGLTEQPDA